MECYSQTIAFFVMTLNKPRHIDKQGDGSITQNCGAWNTRHLSEISLETFDYNLTWLDDFININIVARTENHSYIQIPLEGKGDIKENDFIEFTNSYKDYSTNNYTSITNKIKKAPSVTNLRIDLEVTPSIEVQIIFDPRIGDVLRANGFAHLTIESLGSDFNMYGDYSITKGDFMFTLQNIIKKRLNIQPGSTVSWTGHPLDADIDLDAIYKVRKASVMDLTQDENDREKRVDVNTHLLMTGKLTKPNIKLLDKKIMFMDISVNLWINFNVPSTFTS